MNKFFKQIHNEEGSAIVVTIIVLVVLTILGLSLTTTSVTEVQIASNDQFYKIAFMTAEAARGYVAGNQDLYGPDNITVNSGIDFPDDADPTQRLNMNSTQSFNGDVVYLVGQDPPRGSGYEVGMFKAHVYEMTCFGYGPRNAESRVEAGFYRIGF